MAFEAYGELRAMRLDGTDERLLAQVPKEYGGWSLSPDWAKLVATYRVTGQMMDNPFLAKELDVESGAWRQMSSSLDSLLPLCWSPRTGHLVTTNMFTTGILPGVSGPSIGAMRASWTPDGTRIALADWDEVRAYDVTGGAVSQIAQVDGTEIPEPPGLPGQWWAPDGDHLVVEMKGDIRVIPISGGERKNLTRTGEHEWSPAWSPAVIVDSVVDVESWGGIKRRVP